VDGSSSYGVYNSDASLAINNSIISAIGGDSNYGIFNNSATSYCDVEVHNSQILGSTNSIRNDTMFLTYVGASQLGGGAVISPGGGTVKCIGVYDENYNSAGYTTCP